METNCGVGNKKGEKPSSEMEKIAAAAEPWKEVVWEGVVPAVAELRSLLLSEPKAALLLPKQFAEPMDIEQLEMLEAELTNQGILPADATTVSQHALHSASILRWRARRAGVSADNVYFLVRVPEYVLMRADEIQRELQLRHSESREDTEELFLLRSASWGKGIDSHSRLQQDLLYVDRFASYILGKFGHDTNRYQRGLSLILKIIGNTRQLLSGEIERTNVELPTDPRAFTRRLKDLRLGR